MASEFKHIHRVQFSETDMAGIVHFSNFFRYMEMCEHAFYRSLGFSVVMRETSPPIGFPRVHASCEYKKPLRFEDELEIRLVVREKRPKVLGFDFTFTKLNLDGTRMEAATGKLTVVCVTHADGKLAAVEMPEFIYAQIVPAS